MTASAVALLLAPTAAFAQEAPAECDPNEYPPRQCGVFGGSGHSAPPLIIDRTVAAPGTPVEISVQTGCRPGSPVKVGLTRISSNNSEIIVLTTVTANAEGGFDATTAIPTDLSPGVYVLYTECQDVATDDLIVSTTSFVVVPGGPAAAGAARSSGTSSTGTSTTAARTASYDAADLPDTWAAPAGWTASRASKAAITEAVNFRLAAMKTGLPAQAEADVAAPTATATPTDLTPWAAGAGAVALLTLGAAGWRRRRTSDVEGTVSA